MWCRWFTFVNIMKPRANNTWGLSMWSSSWPSGKLPDIYCHPKTSHSRSASRSVSQKYFMPQRQGSWRNLTKKHDTITRTQLCNHPVAQSSLIPASTRGYPVRPCLHILKYPSSMRQGKNFKFESNDRSCVKGKLKLRYLEYSLNPIDLRKRFTLSSPFSFPSWTHSTCFMLTPRKTFLTLNSP